MMFQLFCAKGHPLALDTALAGMGLEGKAHTVKGQDGQTIEISGKEAPRLWQAGEYAAVLTYCAADVRRTLELAHACAQRGYLAWTSRTGKSKSARFVEGRLAPRERMREAPRARHQLDEGSADPSALRGVDEVSVTCTGTSPGREHRHQCVSRGAAVKLVGAALDDEVQADTTRGLVDVLTAGRDLNLLEVVVVEIGRRTAHRRHVGDHHAIHRPDSVLRARALRLEVGLLPGLVAGDVDPIVSRRLR